MFYSTRQKDLILKCHVLYQSSLFQPQKEMKNTSNFNKLSLLSIMTKLLFPKLNLLEFKVFQKLQYLQSQASMVIFPNLLQLDGLRKINCFKTQLQQAREIVTNREITSYMAINTINKIYSLFKNGKFDKDQEKEQPLGPLNNFFWHFRWKLLKCFLLYQIENLFKIPLLMFLLYMLLSIQQNNSSSAFMYLGFLCLVFLLQTILSQYAQFKAKSLTISIQRYFFKALLLQILDKKVIQDDRKHKFQLKYVPKLDEIFEIKLKLILKGLSIILVIVSTNIILIYIVGWLWLAGFALLVILQLASYHCVNANSYLQQAFLLKKKRQQLFTKAVLDYKEVFMLDWSKAVYKSLQQLRKQQSSKYLKYSLRLALKITLNFGFAATSLLLVQGLNSKYTDNMNPIPINLTVLYAIQFCFYIKDFTYAVVYYSQIKQVFRQISDFLNQIREESVSLNFFSQLKRPSLSSLLEIKSQSQILIVLKKVSIHSQVNFSSGQFIQNVNLQIRAGDFLPIFFENKRDKNRFLKCLTLQGQAFQGQIDMIKEESLATCNSFMLRDTLKQNILMGRQLDQERYHKVLKESHLEYENEIFQDTAIDLTAQADEIEKYGKDVLLTKLSLARCLYSQRQIIILDDIFAIFASYEKTHLIRSFRHESFSKIAVILLLTDLQSASFFDQIYAIKNKMLVKIRNESFKNVQKQRISSKKLIKNEVKTLKIRRKEQPSENAQLQRRHLSFIQNFKKQLQSCELSFWKTLFKYFFCDRKVKILTILTIFCYAASQSLLCLVIRYMNQYHLLKNGQLSPLGNYAQYWGYMSLLAFLTALLYFVRAFLLALTIHKINNFIHKQVVGYLFSNKFKSEQIFKNRAQIQRFMNNFSSLNNRLFDFLSLFLSVLILAVVIMAFYSVANPYLLIFGVALILPIFLWNNYAFLTVHFSKFVHSKHMKYIGYTFSFAIKNLFQIRVNNYQGNLTTKTYAAIDQYSNSKLIYLTLRETYCTYCSYYCVLAVAATYFAVLTSFNQTKIYQFNVLGIYLLSRITYLSSSSEQSIVLLKKLQEMCSLLNRISLSQDKVKKQLSRCSQRKTTNTTQLSQILDYFNKKQTVGQISCPHNANGKNCNFSLHLKKRDKVAIIIKSYHQILNLLFKIPEQQKTLNCSFQGHDASFFSLEQTVKICSLIDLNTQLLFESNKENIDPFDRYKDYQIKQVLKRVISINKQPPIQAQIEALLKKSSQQLDFEQKLDLHLCRVILQNRDIVVIADQPYLRKGKPGLVDKLLVLLAHKAVIFLVQSMAHVEKIHFHRVYNFDLTQHGDQQTEAM